MYHTQNLQPLFLFQWIEWHALSPSNSFFFFSPLSACVFGSVCVLSLGVRSAMPAWRLVTKLSSRSFSSRSLRSPAEGLPHAQQSYLVLGF